MTGVTNDDEAGGEEGCRLTIAKGMDLCKPCDGRSTGEERMSMEGWAGQAATSRHVGGARGNATVV